MRAQKGEWFSLKWEPRNYYDQESYAQLKTCPVFVCASEDTLCIESELENKFSKIRIVDIKLTSIFITLEDGVKVPTHYQTGMFMPGDNKTYDDWLKEYFNLRTELTDQIKDKHLLQQKSIYLEHTAKIIRHDMHSGINTYIPRGLKLLLDKLPEEAIKEHRLGLSIKLLKEGLKHTQNVYRGVYEFTNLVKRKPEFKVEKHNLKKILMGFLEGTSYSNKVELSDLVVSEINPTLFCIALDNFIRNGITYNDSKDKKVKIYMRYNNELVIEDNGVGMTQYEYDLYCMPYMREVKNDDISGLGLNIANAILKEHGFTVNVEKVDTGTVIGVKLL